MTNKKDLLLHFGNNNNGGKIKGILTYANYGFGNSKNNRR